jgi:hypothetical protein
MKMVADANSSAPDPEHRQGHGGEIAKRHADGHRQRGAPALAERIGHDQQDGRARDDQQHGRRGGESEPGFERHLVFLASEKRS